MQTLLEAQTTPRFLSAERARFWDVVSVLARRSIKVRYRGSVLGVYWSLFNPALMSVVYTAIFGKTFTPYYGDSVVLYVLSVFLGLVTMNFFIGATQAALTSVVAQATLVTKVRVPLDALPISAVAAQALQLCIGTVPLMIVIVFFVTRSPWHVFLIPIPIIAMMSLALGIGFIVALLYVYFRDIANIYEFVGFLFWVATPVFYPLAIVPERVRWLLYFNPLLYILQSLRDIVLHQRLESPQLLGVDLLIGVVSCAIGWLCFHLARRHLAELL